jgi:uncharacterized membrane protein YfcA
LDWTTIAIMVGAGLGAGVMGGLLGVGGGSVLLPVLQFALGYSPEVAIGTSLLAVVFTAISGTIQHLRLRNVDWKMVAWIASSGLVGVVAGSALFHFFKGEASLVNLVLGIIFVWISGRMLWEGFIRRKPEAVCREMTGGRGVRMGLGGGAGFLAGISGLGGGAILVPGFTYFCGSTMKLAVGTSMASFLWFALVGAGLKIADGVTDVPAGVILGLATAVGAIGGARMVPRIPGATLKAVFGVVFLYVSLKYILAYFGITI